MSFEMKFCNFVMTSVDTHMPNIAVSHLVAFPSFLFVVIGLLLFHFPGRCFLLLLLPF